MNPLSLFAIATSVAALLFAGCKPGGVSTTPKPSVPPAKVITENDLASVVLDLKAEQRLGIATSTVAIQRIERTRMVGGELLPAWGRPVGAPASSPAFGESILSLFPSMTPAELARIGGLQVDADGQIAAALIEVEASKIAWERARNLVDNSAGTQRGADEARARFQLAESSLATARERRALLGVPIRDTARSDVLWVRVSLYAGDLNRINRAAPARITSLGGQPTEPARIARPLSAPFSTAAAPAAVDLFYELENAGRLFRPGEKVSVAVPLTDESESPAVPAAAVIHDIHGGAWVYENTAPRTFTRRRIEVRFVSDGHAFLARGPKPGAIIVTSGAAELFGTEFGMGK